MLNTIHPSGRCGPPQPHSARKLDTRREGASIVGKNIALAGIDVAHAGFGTQVEIGKLNGHRKRLLAKILSLSHHDPKKTRSQS
ncbi:hypothetical protein EH240_35650 [Mesorhizobium tamadayense]|uniref:Uncharacterized protein n=1 Tax=Mesorhizobium tamadayense TaxID=425306 RepID=A0A3P3EN76_9HYPH|nr:hypothetical protein [Mesorhizobium tamadayense]RRH87863.1 hypothetical protein EH240_35650 [Mesorhizobium tamadayense]